MTILEYKQYFKASLSDRYSDTESVTLFNIFFEKLVGFSPVLQKRFYHQELLDEHIEDLERILSQLRRGIPYQYVLGEAEFYGTTFFVDSEVLIPRPETEELIELAIREIPKLGRSSLKILDIGTGSGIIPIILKKTFPEAEIFGLDVSALALEVAKKNADKHGVDIQWILDDYLKMFLSDHYDVIISNPPYIGQDEKETIEGSVKDFEPNGALFSPTEDPLVFYKKIAEDALRCIRKPGMLFLEINQKWGEETLDLFSHCRYKALIKDISENDRMIFVEY